MEAFAVVDHGSFSVKYAYTGRGRSKTADAPLHELQHRSAHDDDDEEEAVARGRCRRGGRCRGSSSSSVACATDAAAWLTTLSRVLYSSDDNDKDADDARSHDVSSPSVLLLLDAFMPRRQRELLLLGCFEQLGCARVATAYTACTALFAAGECSGVCVDVGYTSVRVTPVVQGLAVVALAAALPSVGARHVDDELLRCRAALPRSPTLSSPPVTTTTDDEELATTDVAAWLLRMKSQHGCVHAATHDATRALPDDQHVVLPGGRGACSADVDAAVARASCRLLYSTRASVPATLHYVYTKAALQHADVQACVCVGASAAVRGVDECLTHSLADVVLPRLTTAPSPPPPPPRLVPVRSRALAALEGGVMALQLSSFRAAATVQASEYAEHGPEACVRQMLMDAR